MGSNKAFLLLALFVALVLVVAERDLAETDTEKHNEVSTESTNVGKAQYGNGGYNGGNGGYNGGHGGYNGGNGGHGGGGRGGGGGGGGGRRGGGCYYGCCRREYYGRGCRRCCSYANEAVEQARP